MAVYNQSTAAGVFKTKYVRMSRDMFNSENIFLAKIKRNDTFVGDQALISTPTSFGGGRSSGSLPRPNVAQYQKMIITPKKTYATIEIDNESMKASQTDEGAFVRLSKEPVKRGVQAWQANASRMLWNDSVSNSGIGNGRLGRYDNNDPAGAATTNPSAGVYVITILASTVANGGWKQSNFETKDFVTVVDSVSGSGTGTEWEITAVVPSTRAVTLTLSQGPLIDLTLGTDPVDVYMQRSRGNDFTGFDGAVRATSGTLFGLTVGYRWQASSQIAAAGAGITPALLNQMFLEVKYAFGETPDIAGTSFIQYRKLLNQLEDQKRYMIVESRNSGPKGKFSFQALEFMCDTGPVPVVAERFCQDDSFFGMNSDFVELHARPEGGWIEDPTTGQMFRASNTNDSWEARYGVYGDIATMPTAHGLISGLSLT